MEDDFGKPVAVEGLVRVVEATTDRRRSEDPALLSIKEAASVDNKYSMVLDAKKAGLQSHEVKKLGKDHPAQAFVHI